MLIIPISGLCKSLSDVAISASSLSWCFVSLCAWIFDSDVFMFLCGNLKPRIKVHSYTEDFLYLLGPCAYSTTTLKSQWNKFTLVMCIWKANLRTASLWLQFLVDVIAPATIYCYYKMSNIFMSYWCRFLLCLEYPPVLFVCLFRFTLCFWPS